MSETVICACPSDPVHRVRARYQHVHGSMYGPRTGIGTGIPGGYMEGYTGYPPTRSQTARGGCRSQRSGPVAPAGGGVVGICARTYWDRPSCAPAHPPTHPCGARSPKGSLVGGWAPHGQRARLRLHFLKVSQNQEVSPKSIEKACHSPRFPKTAPEVTSWISQISILASLLSQGINGSYLTIRRTLLSK